MLEFFIALFGGLYYGGKLLSEKNNKKVAEAKWENWKTTFHLLYDLPAQNDVAKLMKTQEGRNNILESIKDDAIYVFGEQYKDIFDKYMYNDKIGVHNCGLHGFGDIWNIAYVIYLSKLGYINSTEYSYTCVIRGIKKSDIPGKYYEYVQESPDWSRDIGLRTCSVIEKNIQLKHGSNCRLVDLCAPSYVGIKKTWEFDGIK